MLLKLEHTSEVIEGKLTPSIEHDPFTLALGKPYHPGRVIGFGGKQLGWEKVMGSEYTKSAKSRSSVNSPHRIDEKEKESIKAEIRAELQEQMQSQFNAILKHMNLPPLPFPSSTPVDSCSHPGGPEDDPVVEREVILVQGRITSYEVRQMRSFACLIILLLQDPSLMDAESLKRANPMPEPFPDVKVNFTT